MTQRDISPKPKKLSKNASYPQHVTTNHHYNSPPMPFNDVSATSKKDVILICKSYTDCFIEMDVTIISNLWIYSFLL